MKVLTDGIFNKRCETPVVFFIYNRPSLVEKTFSAIRNARPTQLLVISDGPKNSPEDEQLVQASRSHVSIVDWDCEVRFLFSPSNLGLRERIITGLDEAFRFYDAAIILEDDCMPSEYFFPFCEVLLSRYQNTDVGLVAGFNNGSFRSRSRKYYFSDFPEIWGWATWAPIWRQFREAEAKREWSELEITSQLKSLNSRISRSRIARMARLNLALDTWDIEFAMHLIKMGKLTAIPDVNLVLNQGFGNDATHTKFLPPGLVNKTGELIVPLLEPARISAQRFHQIRQLFVQLARSLCNISKNPTRYVQSIAEVVFARSTRKM